jgi:molybdopterin molybdotransferase
MTATAGSEVGPGLTAPAMAEREPTPLADYLGSVLRRVRVLPPLDLDLTEAYGNVLA